MDNWPTPSILDRFLFESYWPAAALCAGLALVLGFHALRRRSRGLGVAAVVLVLAAATVPVVARSIVTSRERLMARTADLAKAAIGPLDADQLAAMLDERVVFEVPRGNPAFEGRDQVIDLARRADRRYRFETWSVGGLDAAKLNNTTGQSVARLSTRLVAKGGGDGLLGGEYSVPTDWLIEWSNRSGDWRVTRIALTKIAGQDASAGQLP